MLCPISSIFYQNCFKDAWNSIPVVEVTFRAMSRRSRSSETLPYQGDTGYGPIRAGNSLAELPVLQADGAGLNNTFSWQTSKTLNRKREYAGYSGSDNPNSLVLKKKLECYSPTLEPLFPGGGAFAGITAVAVFLKIAITGARTESLPEVAPPLPEIIG